MKATEARFLAFIKKSPQFIVPIYQRTYSWTNTECQQLWDDIIRAGSDPAVTGHFVGSIVYIEEGLSSVSSQEPLLVIDGQQRLTTLTLILIALAEGLEQLPDDQKEPFEGFSPRKVRNYYLVNPEEEGERHFKLLLSQNDRTTLTAIVGGHKLPPVPSVRITSNLDLFRSFVKSKTTDIIKVCQGLSKLILVDLALDRNQDNPQLIFESMNSTGRELSQADLVRNFILMGLDPNQQASLYNNYWRPMEVQFGQEAYSDYFDAFMRHYLTIKTGEIPRIDEVYISFKKYARTPSGSKKGVGGLVQDIHDFAGYFCAMALNKELDPELSRAFSDLRELTVEVAYPFLLEIYHDFKHQHLSKSQLVKTIRLVEAYVFRRAICAIPANSMNKTFATLSRALKKDRYFESIQAYFLLLPSYRRFPADDEFKREIQTRDVYNFRSRTYWIRRMENYGRKERVAVQEYTIEHILPQSGNDPSKVPLEWQKELGPDWENVWSAYRHTIGNLTLSGYNSEYSDRPFAQKRDMAGGFKESPLKLNQGLGQISAWNEGSIKDRALKLSALAELVWPGPQLERSILNAYKPTTTKSQYTINDHQFLQAGATRELFDAFSSVVLGMDPCVTREYLKLYVAFKAETNFTDVVPQAKRLRVSLNMKFADVNDPRGICKDVSGIGRWGNGDVEVMLSSIDDLPYVTGLVRQSFERQMGNAADI